MNKLITGLLTIGLIVSLSLTAYGAKTYKKKTPDNTVYDKKDVVVEVKETNIIDIKNRKWGMVLREIASAQKDIVKMNTDMVRRQVQLDAWIALRDAIQIEVDKVVLKVSEP